MQIFSKYHLTVNSDFPKKTVELKNKTFIPTHLQQKKKNTLSYALEFWRKKKRKIELKITRMQKTLPHTHTHRYNKKQQILTVCARGIL